MSRTPRNSPTRLARVARLSPLATESNSCEGMASRIKRLDQPQQPSGHGHFTYAFFLFAQRRFAPAIILARASGLMARFGADLAADFDGAVFAEAAGLPGVGPPFARAAQRAFRAATILARPSGVNPPFFLAAAADFSSLLQSGVIPESIAFKEAFTQLALAHYC